MNNKAYIVGTVGSEIRLSHCTGGEKFSEFTVEVARDSGYLDKLKCIASEKVYLGMDLKIGTRIEIYGQYRSFSKRREDGTRDTQLFIFIDEIKEASEEDSKDINSIELNGEIIRCYSCRHTKTGRNVTDFVIKVPREYSRDDYLNCIAWGRDAKLLGKLKDEISKDSPVKARVLGRLQSRVFTKFYEDGSKEDREIYELSVNDLAIDLEAEMKKDINTDGVADGADDGSKSTEE